MKVVEFLGNMNSKKKLLMSLYWINRKVASSKGCEPFLIRKVITENNTYSATADQWIKLSNVILDDILMNIEFNKNVEFQINFGNEVIDFSIYKNMLSISTKWNRELETEIIKKIEIEGRKMYPTICPKFPKRVGLVNYP